MSVFDFIPFGSQYYRAPTPVEQDWERDLKSFKEHGFNTIKIWLQWRWNHPKEDTYYFDDMKRLLDIAQQNGLKVIINIILDIAPVWFDKKYPDARMITSNGREIKPSACCSRQIGGTPGPCLHHEEGNRIRREFIEAAAKELGSHPALLCWDLWNEPEIFSGLKKNALEEDMVCYCENSIEKFQAWLCKKYGSIEALNQAWARNYQDFSEVEAPIYSQTFNDMIDWRIFFMETMAADMQMRADAVKKYDKQHPVMAHTVTIPYFSMTAGCSDDYLLAQPCDLFGNSVGSEPFPAHITTSAAEGKTILNAEIHAIGGSTFGRPGIPTFEQMKRHIFVPLGRGVKGFLFWQYKPERLGLESPAWGLTELDGSSTPWLEQSKTINNAIQENEEYLLHSLPKPAEIAVINYNKDLIFSWCIAHDDRLYYHSIRGAFSAIYNDNFTVDILSGHQVVKEKLKQYKCIYLPFPYYMEQRIADVLREWIAEGGTLISEMLFGGYEGETNLHAVKIPGYGFDDIFGVTEKRVVTASTFKNAYSAKWSEDNKDESAIGLYEEEGRPLATGYFICEHFANRDASPIAYYNDGSVAATVSNYGKGKAIMLGTLLGYQVSVNNDLKTAEFLAGLVKQYGNVQQTVDCDAARVDILYQDNEPAALVVAAQKEMKNTVIHMNGAAQNIRRIKNIITGEILPVAEGSFSLTLPSDGIETYVVLKD